MNVKNVMRLYLKVRGNTRDEAGLRPLGDEAVTGAVDSGATAVATVAAALESDPERQCTSGAMGHLAVDPRETGAPFDQNLRSLPQGVLHLNYLRMHLRKPRLEVCLRSVGGESADNAATVVVGVGFADDASDGDSYFQRADSPVKWSTFRPLGCVYLNLYFSFDLKRRTLLCCCWTVAHTVTHTHFLQAPVW